MHNIELKKFGTVLVSRPAGLEAFQAIRPTIDMHQPVQVDFEGVLTVTPSWFDEFITNLAEYMHNRVELLPTRNASVRAMLPVLAAGRLDETGKILRRALEAMQTLGQK